MAIILAILNIVGKCASMDYRVFLPMYHQWRSNKRSFNGKTEFRPPPAPLKGIDVLNSLRDFENVFGKKKKRSNDGPWKKRSIFLITLLAAQLVTSQP